MEIFRYPIRYWKKAVGALWRIQGALNGSRPNMEHGSQEVSFPLSLSLIVTVRAVQHTRRKWTPPLWTVFASILMDCMCHVWSVTIHVSISSWMKSPEEWNKEHHLTNIPLHFAINVGKKENKLSLSLLHGFMQGDVSVSSKVVWCLSERSTQHTCQNKRRAASFSKSVLSSSKHWQAGHRCQKLSIDQRSQST